MNDLKFAFRQLLKNPGFPAVAVLTLAVGIGATSAVFNLIHATLLTPPPYPNPERIILILPSRLDGQPKLGCTTGQWLDWQKEAKSFAAIAAYDTWAMNYLVLPQGSESMTGLEVTPAYFPDTDPIGKRLGHRPASFSNFSAEIIGVVANARTEDLSHEPTPELYLTLWQADAYTNSAADSLAS